MTLIPHLAALFAPKPASRLKPLNARVLIGGGGIVACRDAPGFIADRRSLVAGIAIYMAIALVVAILAVVLAGVGKGGM